MELAELKPLLTALALPPAGPLLLALLGLLLMGRRWLGGAVVSLLGIASLWFLSCNAVGLGLAAALLPLIEPLKPQGAQMSNVQAIVVLGAGLRLPIFWRLAGPQDEQAAGLRRRRRLGGGRHRNCVRGRGRPRFFAR
jgi:hypothetical protein